MVQKAHLKIAAKEHHDFHILSTHARDALISLSSMSLDKSKGTFSMLLNRFCWEHDPIPYDDGYYYYRIHSGLRFHHVNRAYYKGFDRHETNDNLWTLNLLHIDTPEEKTIRCIFSGLAELVIVVDSLHCQLGDQGEHWHTPHKPMHLHEHLNGF